MKSKKPENNVSETQSLRESEERFRMLADNIPNLAWMAKADGWIYWYNKKWYEYTGTTAGQTEGWGWQTIHDPKMLPDVVENWKNAISKGEPFEMVFPLKGADGQFRQFLTRVLPVRNKEGEIYQWFGSNTDITRQIEIEDALKESKTALEFAIEATNLGTWDYNPLSNKFSSNDQVKKWFGLFPEERIELTHAVNAILESDRQRVTDAIQKALDFSSGGNYDIEYTIVHPVTKKETIVRAKGRAWFNDEKIAYRFNGTLEDVTERAIAAKKIRESEQRFEAAVQALNGIVWTGNAKGEMQGEQRGWAELTGQKYEEYQGCGWIKAIHPDDAQATIDAWNEAVKNITTFHFEHRVKMKDGSWRNFSIRALPLLDSNRTLREWVGVHIDITEQKVAETKIRESERRYHHLIISSPSAIGILEGENLIITTANDAIIEIWGKGKEIMGKPYFEALPELAEQGYRDVFARVYKTGNPFNAIETPVYILQNGRMELKYYNFLLYAQKNILGEIDGIGIIASEVTSQALLNTQVKESEKRFRLLADSMPQHIWTADTEGNLNYYNKSLFDYSGLTVEQLNNDGWIQIVHPDDREENIRHWINSVTTGNEFLFEHRFRKHTGEYRWQLSRAIAQKDENGKIQIWVGTSTDIEEQKTFSAELKRQVEESTKYLVESNESLKKSEQQYHLMVEEVQDYAILYLNREGIIENWNAGAEKIKGYRAAEIIGKNFSDFYTEGDRKSKLPQKLLERAVETGKAAQEGWRVKKNGDLFWASVVITAVHDTENNVIGFSKVTHDLTAKKEADDELKKNAAELERKNKDLEKINKELQSFAYISSHDLQEPLRKIQTFASRLIETEYHNLPDNGRDQLKKIQDAAERMQTLIDDLLAYSRTNNEERKYENTDLKKIVEQVKADLEEEIQEKHASIEATALCELNIIPFQFRQLLYNLLSNSLKFSNRDLAPHIEIKSKIATGSEFRNDRLSDKVNYCHISFTDNGIGFDPQYSEKIFELFQRLHGKTEYNGTGIGLAIVKKIVENHNGFITVTSKLKEGTTFDIFLPVNSTEYKPVGSYV